MAESNSISLSMKSDEKPLVMSAAIVPISPIASPTLINCDKSWELRPKMWIIVRQINSHRDRQTDRKKDIHTVRQTDRHRDRQTERQSVTETDRQTDRQTERQSVTETDRQADRHTDTHTVSHTDRLPDRQPLEVLDL